MTEQDQCQKVYLAYPRHVAPRAALKAIQRAAERLVREKAQPDEHTARRYLWKRATEYSRSPAGQKPPKGSNDYRPHPATWFNQSRFEDDSTEWLKPNGVNGNGKHATADNETIARANAKIAELGGNHLRAR